MFMWSRPGHGFPTIGKPDVQHVPAEPCPHPPRNEHLVEHSASNRSALRFCDVNPQRVVPYRSASAPVQRDPIDCKQEDLYWPSSRRCQPSSPPPLPPSISGPI